MRGIPESVRAAVETQLGVSIAHEKPLGGGCVSDAFSIEGKKGEHYFLKVKEDAPPGFFTAESDGLNALRAAKAVTVPKVIGVHEATHYVPSFILLELLETARGTHLDSQRLGEQLAKLHRTTGSKFGFKTPNFIGLNPQENTWSKSWPDFFFEHRLRYQANLGEKHGWFTSELSHIFASKEETIRKRLGDFPAKPSLLHGDLWNGNVVNTAHGPALIDPAVYYGDREAEIAFTELFGGFDEAFYDVYEQNGPLHSGYASRKRLHNLYHLMNHANLFGGSYISQVFAILRVL